MYKRPNDILIADILESIQKITEYTNSIDYQEFSQNSMIIDAVVRNLEIIGEAANKLTEEYKSGINLPWHRIIGLRNRIVHEYFGVDIGIIWKIITSDLPQISAVLSKEK